ncbi:biotin/lipoate--protein ligase family protein [Pseudogemmobacter sp. W21_MBD1_M6]|uniref:biotin/lipoate--protein ligase family protein n=1 Tax=Pseudogemmobacter sp. W21_MBD1_M6 TaxID=3240271 RepID=UPI003F9D5B93
MSTPDTPTFPPLLRGESVPAHADPFLKAVNSATQGTDPGLILWSEDTTNFRVAVILAPEMPLQKAMGAAYAAQLGFADSLGALGPPEVAVHFVWPDRIKVNGAMCGHMRYAASTRDGAQEPDWLVIGIDVPLLPVRNLEPGVTPDETTLYDEGCTDLTAAMLIESWSRHMLVWLHQFMNEGLEPLHRAWSGKCDTLGQEVTMPETGTFMGLDEYGNMLLRDASGTRVIPLYACQEV